MVQSGHCPRLLLESPGEAPLGNLDGNRAVQTGVARAENLSHAASPKGGFDSVLPQLGPGGEARAGGFPLWFPDRPVQARVAGVLLEQHTGDSRLDRAVWEPKGESTGARFATGTQLGQYRIEAALGAGGMGEVFRARDTRLNRTVAIKISKRRFTGRFKQEARAVAALNHPNIVQVFELGSEDGDDFIAMEFVPGRTLAELIRIAPLSLDQALEYSNQIASALAAAHAAGIVHRDIKPGNIIVSDAGVVQVLDFGLAKVEQSAAARDTTLTLGAQTGA